MHNYKNLLISIGILSSVFYGCGFSPAIKTSIVNQEKVYSNMPEKMGKLITTNFTDFEKYTPTSSSEDLVVIVNKNSVKKYFNRLFERFTSDQQGNRKQNDSEKKEQLRNYGKIINFVVGDYCTVSKEEVRKMLRSICNNNSVDLIKTVQALIPTDIKTSIKKEIDTSFNGVVSPEIIFSNLEFFVASQVINILNIIDVAIEIASYQQTTTSVSVLETKKTEAINAFYETYNEIFKQKTGLTIDLKEMCKDDKFSTKLDNGLVILSGLAIEAIERYSIVCKHLTNDRTATLDSIFGKKTSAQELERSLAYKLFRDSTKRRIDEVLTSIAQKYTPYASFDKNKKNQQIQQNSKVTLADLNKLENLAQYFINMSDIVSPAPEFKFIENNPFIKIDNNKVSIIMSQNENILAANELAGKIIEKNQKELLNNIVSDIYSAIKNQQRENAKENQKIKKIEPTAPAIPFVFDITKVQLVPKSIK